MTELGQIFEKLGCRVATIQQYHKQFSDFLPGDDEGAATYGMIMRSQVDGFLKLVQEWKDYFQINE